MADSKLEDLTPNAALSGTDLLYLVQPGGSRVVTLDEIAEWVKTAETIIPADLPYRGARVYRTTDQTAITWPIVVSWQAAEFDTDAFWNIANPTQLVIPAGISKVRLTASVQFESSAVVGSLGANIRLNGTGTTGLSGLGRVDSYPRFDAAGFTTNLVSAFTAAIPVVAGDYFDLRLNVNMSGVDQLIGVESRTWFDIEVLETS